MLIDLVKKSRNSSKYLSQDQWSTDRANENTSERDQSCTDHSYPKLLYKHNRALNFAIDLSINNDMPQRDQQPLGRRELSAEVRVTRSLAVIVGCFICCWLPFFTLYIIRAICHCLSFNAIEFFVWLGYSNSSINPILYAILNRNFHLAFKNIFLSIKKIIFT